MSTSKRTQHGSRRAPTWTACALATFAVVSGPVGCGEATHTVGVLDESSTLAGRSGAAAPGSGAAGSGGVGGTVSTGGTSGTAGLAPNIECAATAVPATAKRLNLYFVIATTFAIPVTVWDVIKSAVASYVDDPRTVGTGLGVDLFGLEFSGIDVCVPDPYVTPDVGISLEPLPANASEIQRALEDHTFGLTTIFPSSPIGPALLGAERYVQSRAAAYPNDRFAMVLFTDGFFDSCNSADGLAALAGDILERGLSTYVVELTAPGPVDTTLIPLENIARSGGTGAPWTFDSGSASAQDFTNMLVDLQHVAEPCEYTLPAGESLDTALLAVDNGAGPMPLPRRASEAECAGADGVFLDRSTGTEWARTCATSCGRIKSSGRPPVWLLGCDDESH